MKKPLRIQIFEMAGFILVFLILCATAWFFLRPGPYDIPYSDWKIFKQLFIDPSGRVVDTGNQHVSHSEGQGYGMLFAVAFKDRSTFDQIWQWTKTHLQTRENDKLLSWQWQPANDDQPEGVVDTNNASDGDLLVAWALLRAHDLWEVYEYKQAAAQILTDLKQLDIKPFKEWNVLLPGTYGFTEKEDSITLNLSYYVFPALQAAHQAFPSAGWDKIAKDGEQIIQESKFGSFDLCPDWIEINKSIEISPNFSPIFGYNAIRIPLQIAWANLPNTLLAPFAEFWKNRLQSLPATVNLETDEFGSDPALQGMKEIALFTVAQYKGKLTTVAEIPLIDPAESYYSASLKLLTKLAIRDKYQQTKISLSKSTR